MIKTYVLGTISLNTEIKKSETAKSENCSWSYLWLVLHTFIPGLVVDLANRRCMGDRERQLLFAEELLIEPAMTNWVAMWCNTGQSLCRHSLGIFKRISSRRMYTNFLCCRTFHVNSSLTVNKKCYHQFPFAHSLSWPKPCLLHGDAEDFCTTDPLFHCES